MKILIRIGMAGMLACGILSAVQSATSTSLGLTVSGTPASASTLGKTVTLTATVLVQGTSNPVTTGSVTFFSGTNPVGSGVLNGSGKATFSTTLLPAGPNPLMAFYVGVTGSLGPSVSSASAFTVNSAKQNGFATPATFTTGVGNYPYGIAVADFNGDGNADLAIADLQGKSVSVLLGNGAGAFTPATGSPYLLSYLAYAVAVGDFNGDGLPDLAVAISGGSSASFVSILLNTSTGTSTATFGPAANYATGSVNMSAAIAVGDFNGDGIADLALANSNDETVGVTLGKGDGTFPVSNASVKTFAIGGVPNAIAVADYNVDGKADIATANRGVSGAATVSILLNSSTGSSSLTFASAANYPLGTLNDDPLSLASADFNGDGYPDLAIGNYYSSTPNTVSVFLNMGAGSPSHFSEAAGSPYAVGGSSLNVLQDVIVGDFNGDGLIDIAALNSPQGSFTVLRGNGSGGFAVQGTYPATAAAAFTIAFAVADFNGDGVSDLASINASNNNASIILGFGTATTTTLMSSPNPSALGQSVVLTAAVTPSATAGDTVTFFADGVSLGSSAIAISHGAASATLSTSALVGGVHALTATYNGGATYSSSSTLTPISQTVNPTASITILTTAPNPSAPGQGVLLTATVTTGATGTVSFYNNAILLATRPLSGSAPDTAAYTVSNLPSGTNSNSITAVYSGDTNYLTSTSNAINQIVTGTTVTSLSLGSGTNPSATGQTLTLKATVTPSTATGTITFFDGATQLGVVGLIGGTASYSTSTLSAGAHSLTAVYSGDTNDPGSTSTILSQNVRTSSTTTLSSAVTPLGSGKTFLLTATVTTGATGTVSFYNNGVTLLATQPLSLTNPNVATLMVSSLLPAGSANSITATYNGDLTYVTSTSNAVNTTALNSTVTGLVLSSGTNPSTAGQALTLRAMVTPSTAAGIVTFFDGVTQLSQVSLIGGTASYSTSALSAGTHSLTAVYSGDTNDAASTSPILTQTVTGGAAILTAAPNPSIAGQGVLLTATVPTGATGTVSFYDNVSTLISTQPLSGGNPNIAAFTVPNLPAAPSPNSITAIYSGDANFSAGTSNAVNQIVMNTTVTSLILSSGTNPSTAGQPLTFQATVTPPTAGGTVTFFDGSTQLGQVNLSGGMASYPTSALSGGAHSLTAVYGADTNDAGSTSAILTQTIQTSTITTVSVPGSTVFGQVATLRALVSPLPASAPFGTVTFYDGAIVLGTAPLPASGPASFNTAMLGQGPRTIRAHYNGAGAFMPSLSAVANPQVLVGSHSQGGFNPEVVYPGSPATIPGAVGTVAGDFNSDGNWDLAVITSGAGSPGVQILLGNGDGTFQAPLFYATLATSGTPTAIAAGDFNGDGFQDLAVVTSSSIQVLLNNGNGSFGSAMSSSPGAASSLDSIAVTDFNGDGFPDVIVGGNGSAATLLGNGDGTFRTAVPVPAALSNQVYVVAADFNSDGNADFAVADYAGDLDIFLGNGDGTFGSPGAYPQAGKLLSIAAGDINGDGNPDVVLGTTANNLLVLFGNNAGGLGSPASPALTTAGAVAALVAIGDFNGDGVLDVAVADNQNGGIYVFPSNGDGTFRSPLSHTTPSGIPNAIMTGNFEGDGLGDIVITDGIEAGVLLGSPILSVNCASSSGPVVVNVPLSLSCSASGGTAPYSYSISTGLLPPGSPAVSLNASTGSIGGTPNTPGNFSFTVQAKDSSAPSQVALSAGLTINVAAALTPTTTTLSLSSGTNPSTSGQSLTFQATVLPNAVSPNTATGSVTFFDGVNQLGSGNLSGGIATFTTSTLSAGLHSIGATYNGDMNDASSNATALAQTVNQPGSTGPPPPTGPAPPMISTTTLPNGQVGKSYTTVLMATNGSGNYSWSSGTLPQGLGISVSGTISGIPTAPFNGQVSVSVLDLTSGLSASTLLNLVLSAPIKISGNTSLGDVAVGAAVSASYSASGGIAPYKFSLTGAPGLTVDANGNVRGTTAQSGIFTPALTVTDSVNSTSSLTLSLAVLGISSSLPAGTTTTAYRGSVSGVGGVAPYSYAISGVPQGLTVSGGTLSGQVTIEGTYTIGARVTDSNGVGISQDFSVAISGAAPSSLTIVTTSLPDGFVGQPYSLTLEAVGGAPGYTWSKSGGQIPGGLSLSGAGTVSGIPVAPGSSIIGVLVSDTSGAQVVGTVTINIQPAPLQITNGPTFPTGLLAEVYPTQILNATGGTPPYSFSIQGSQANARQAVSSGALGIAGLALSQGQIGGTPEAIGSFGFTLVVTDSAPMPATSNLAANITIEPNTPDLILSSASASFALASGASAPPLPNAITVASSVVSQILTFTASSSVPWLTVSGSSTTPGSIEFGPNTAALALTAAGSPYSGTVTLACTSLVCAGKSHTIAVSLAISAPPPQLSLGSPLLSFTASASNPQPSPAALGIVNAGGGSLAIQSVVASANWISVGAFPSNVAPGPGGSVAVTVNPAGLNPGYYLGSVTVASSAGNVTVPITFLLTASGFMTLAPGGTQFSIPQGGALAHSGGAFLVSVSNGSANFNAVVLPGASWLSGGGTGVASPATPGTVNFSINQSAVAALPAGFYYGTLRVTSSGVVDSPQDFQVVLSIGPADSENIPDPQAAGLVFIGSGPAQTIQLFGSSANSIEFQTSPTTIDGSGWLTVTPQIGSASASSPAQITVTANPMGLSPGVYRGGVGFAYASSVRTVNVTLIVPPSQSTPSCTGTQLVPTQTGLVSDFSVPASLPVPLAVQLRDTCGNAIGNAQVVATFSNGDPPLIVAPVDTVNGIYSRTWTPRNTSSQVTVLTMASAAGYTPAATKTPGQVAPDAAPVLAPNGTLDVFNPQVGAGLAPGNIVQIYGTGLAGPATASTVLPLPTAVNGASVTIGGLSAPLYYVSPGQINAQIPFELTAGNQYQVVVDTNGALTTPQPIQLTQADAAVLQLNSGEVIAQHHDGTLIQNSSPAAPGEYVTIYLSGMGATNGPVVSGAASPASPLANVTDTATLTLDGAQVPVLFQGLTPTLVGLYQINFQMPQPLANGNYTLSIAQSGTASNNTVLPVKN